MGVQIYRVTVRGRFDGLDDDARAQLLADAPDHDALDARFTPDGTLTYDRSLDFFSFRVEVRAQSDDDPDVAASAGDQATVRLIELLGRRSVGHRSLRVQATNMADVWS